jgi:hypothetical protein
VTIKKLDFKYPFSRRKIKLTHSVKEAAREAFGDTRYAAGQNAPERIGAHDGVPQNAPAPEPTPKAEEAISQVALRAFPELKPSAGGLSNVQRSGSPGALLSSLKRNA